MNRLTNVVELDGRGGGFQEKAAHLSAAGGAAGRGCVEPAVSRARDAWSWLVGTGLCLWLLAGCATPGPSGRSSDKLAEELSRLSPSVDAREASLAAATAYAYSQELARQYRVVRPAIFHNMLVNIGVRKRGLCFQWADDLSAKLKSLNLRTLQLHRGVARWETRREHSSVVLTAPGQAFDQGIILDGWRHSGRLYWCGVHEDKYPWIEVQVIAEHEAFHEIGQ